MKLPELNFIIAMLFFPYPRVWLSSVEEGIIYPSIYFFDAYAYMTTVVTHWQLEIISSF
jgi:hypothetical protein